MNETTEEKPEGTGEDTGQVSQSQARKVDSSGESSGVVSRKEFESLQGLVRQMQSQRDKRADKQGKEIEQIIGRLQQYDELVAQGYTRQSALKEIQRDLQYEQLQSSLVAGGPGELEQAPPSKQAPEDPLETVIAGLGLDPNSDKVLAVLRQKASVQEKVSALAGLVGGKSAPEENPAGIISTGGGPAPKEDLLAAYQKEVAPYRGNIAEVVKIQAKYRNLGLSI